MPISNFADTRLGGPSPSSKHSWAPALVLLVIDLVRDEQDRLAAPPQELGGLAIETA